jgi:hypothetical protein
MKAHLRDSSRSKNNQLISSRKLARIPLEYSDIGKSSKCDWILITTKIDDKCHILTLKPRDK